MQAAGTQYRLWKNRRRKVVQWALTPSVVLVLALFLHPRTWCALCPIGTVQAATGGRRHPLHLNGATCRTCHLCEKACPMNLTILRHKASGCVAEPDCLHCQECIRVCPAHALTEPAA
jgi:polyferredoxin